MQTPKQYKENLKQGVINESMLSDVLYSYSKRAKNYRDKRREDKGRSRYDRYKTADIDKCSEKIDEYYGKKDAILKHYSKYAKCIHKVMKGHRIRIYEYEDKWNSLEGEISLYLNGKPSKVKYYSSYFDKDEDQVVFFCDIWENYYLYFVFFEIGTHSFHNPIEEEDLDEYKNLEIIELPELVTDGTDINNLLSIQFCDKVHNFIIHQPN